LSALLQRLRRRELGEGGGLRANRIFGVGCPRGMVARLSFWARLRPSAFALFLKRGKRER